VYTRHLPSIILYEDPSVTKGFVAGKHAVFSFTHQATTGMSVEIAKQCAENILSIFHHGAEPPITQAIVDALHTKGIPPMMPKELIKAAIPHVDVAACNSHITSLFSPSNGAANGGLVRVERIFTCMGCVLTTCVVEVDKLPVINKSLMSWVKPIMEASTAKSKACIQWRMHLESRYNCCSQGPDGMLAALAMAADIGEHEHRHAHARRTKGMHRNQHRASLGSAYTGMMDLPDARA
jgi:hypothetical protein